MAGGTTISSATSTSTAPLSSPPPARPPAGGSPLAWLFGRRTARTAVGLDVGSRAAKAVQLERTAAGGVRVAAAAEVPRAEADDAAGAAPAGEGRPVTPGEAAALAAALAAAGFRGRPAVLAAPSAVAMIGPLDLPPRGSGAPFDQIARLETARNFRRPPGSFELAWWEVPPAAGRGRGTQALAVGLPHAEADALLDALEQPPRFDVRAVDAGPPALVRACRPVLAAHGITAILDLGDGPATLSLVYAGVLTFSRRIPEGAAGPLQRGLCAALAVDADVADYLLAHVGLDVRPPAAAAGRRVLADAAAAAGDALAAGDADSADEALAVDDDDDPIEMPDAGRRLIYAYVDTLVKELSLSFSYACNQYPDAAVVKLVLVGGGARLAGLPGRLSAALSVEAVPVAPADLVECDPAALSACRSPALMLALGLAMHDAA
jgi:Tfp pilus assembly PilM family ATPase